MLVYDSPGYGDFINNQEAVNKVKAFILKCHQDWRALDAQSMTEAEFLQADSRIHCVFYFIAPHRLKEIDVEFITQLAPLVPILPVVAKSDIMTVKERNAFLTLVKEKIEKISGALGEPAVYDFSGDDVDATPGDGVHQDEVPPPVGGLLRVPNLFSIVSDASSERAYPWGTLKIDDENVSDFRRLQGILFENGLYII